MDGIWGFSVGLHCSLSRWPKQPVIFWIIPRRTITLQPRAGIAFADVLFSSPPMPATLWKQAVRPCGRKTQVLIKCPIWAMKSFHSQKHPPQKKIWTEAKLIKVVPFHSKQGFAFFQRLHNFLSTCSSSHVFFSFDQKTRQNSNRHMPITSQRLRIQCNQPRTYSNVAGVRKSKLWPCILIQGAQQRDLANSTSSPGEQTTALVLGTCRFYANHQIKSVAQRTSHVLVRFAPMPRPFPASPGLDRALLVPHLPREGC